MKCSGMHLLSMGIIAVALFVLAGCGLGEGIHVSRDEGKSTSRFRYEFEMIPNAVVMREDTEPRWQLGRYVFVRGADRVLVVSRVTSWSDTATKKQRESGDIPGMEDQILERLWITIPQGTAVGQELDLHALSYRFLINYDRGDVGDAQFAHPFRALGNVRILEEGQDVMKVRLRLRLTTDQTTAWEVFERELAVPVLPQGRHAKMARPDSVIYAISRPGELPSTGMTPVEVTPQMTRSQASSEGGVTVKPEPLPESGDASADGAPGHASPPPAMTAQKTPASEASAPAIASKDDAQGDQSSQDEARTLEEARKPSQEASDQAMPEDEAAAAAGRWYFRSQAWEVFMQLKQDGTFIHAASRPQGVPIVVRGDWRIRSGYLVLQIKNIMVGQANQTASRQNNPYAMLKLTWFGPNTVVMDGDMPAPGPQAGGYRMRRAHFPDLDFIAPQPYRPNMPEPAYVGEQAADAQADNGGKTGSGDQPSSNQSDEAGAPQAQPESLPELR